MDLDWVESLSAANRKFVMKELNKENDTLKELQKGPQVDPMSITSFWPHPWPFDQFEGLPEEGTLIEIGPYLGKSTVTWSELLPKWKIHSVDLFMGITPKGRSDKVSNAFLDSLMISEEEHLRTFVKNIAGRDNITYEKAYFREEYIPPQDFHSPTVMWYDGLHDYDNVARAIDYWKGKALNIIVDCYDEEHPGTVEAVDKCGLPIRQTVYAGSLDNPWDQTKGIVLL
tara:strand:- start:1144 stop:1827 length:684 start_codon:yes stop_codon:yes gene_type:complete